MFVFLSLKDKRQVINMISLTFIDIFSENEDYISFQGQLNYTRFDRSFDWTEGGA